MEQIEQTAEAERAGARKNLPQGAVSMKFSDVGQLWRAYQNLEAEFTRKCQKLSELERTGGALPNPKDNRGMKKDSADDSTSPVFAFEKPCDRASAEKSSAGIPRSDDANAGEHPENEPAKTSKRESAGRDGRPERPKEGLPESERGGGDAALADAAPARESPFRISEELRETVIRDYLNSVAAGAAFDIPVGEKRVIALPAKRPRSVSEAGDCFLKDLGR